MTLISGSGYTIAYMTKRHYSKIDQFCLHLDQALRAISGHAATTERGYPASAIAESSLSPEQRKQAAGLMRVNHAGE